MGIEPKDFYAIVAPHLISQYERVHYYHGISPEPPELQYRSNLESDAFPVRHPGARWFKLPSKTAEGVFDTPLNPVWDTVAPLIIALMKERGIKFSALMTTRFSILHEDDRRTLGPIVIWIATYPGSTSPAAARDASPGILHILEKYEVSGAVVEWFEGVVQNFADAALMHVVHDTNPTHGLRHPFTTALGIPISVQGMGEHDAGGTASFFLHERKDKSGAPSNRVLAVTTKHVLFKDLTVDYEFSGSDTEATRRYVRVCGTRRFQRAVEEISHELSVKEKRYTYLTEDVARLEAKEKSVNSGVVKDDKWALTTRRSQLAEASRDIEELKAILNVVSTPGWTDIRQRNIGFVDWAPKVSASDEKVPYILDIGTFVLDPAKFQENFLGNVVDLGNKYSLYELEGMFWSHQAGKTIPYDGLLRIHDVVPRQDVIPPDSHDANGVPVYIVAKYGNTTDLTVGRHSGLDAYLCDEFGKVVKAVAVYNYSRTSGNFSAKGDSGSLIFTGDGRMLAILHSGMPKGTSNHVTFGIPAWCAIEQLRDQYPHADFYGTNFFAA